MKASGVTVVAASSFPLRLGRLIEDRQSAQWARAWLGIREE